MIHVPQNLMKACMSFVEMKKENMKKKLAVKRKEKKIQISVVENYEFSVFVHKMFQILFNRLMKTHDP